jgi:adenosylmethionine-8-amino-7-oxononanoate aminotransferase
VREVLEADDEFVLRHGYTYSGHPAACAASLANVALLRDEALLERVPHLAERFASGFGALLDEGLLAEVRGAGAIWGVGLHPDTAALDVRAALLERGVIARPIGTATIAFCPPLVIDDDDLDRCISALADAIRSLR